MSLNKHKYRGINHLLLSSDEFSSPVWGTFNQVRKNGGTVNKGEKSTLVVFWKKTTYQKVDQDTGEIFDENRFFLKYYNVFNSQQCSFDSIGQEKIDLLSKASEKHCNERYFPGEDIVERMPNRPQKQT